MNIYIVTGFTKWGSDIISAHRDLEVANEKAEAWLRDALLDQGFSPNEVNEAFENGEELDLHDETHYKVSVTTLD